MRATVAIVFAVSVLSSHTLRAQSVVIESHTGSRRADADRFMAPIADELGNRHYMVGEKAARRIEATSSRPGDPDGIQAADLVGQADTGYRAWLRGDFAAAVDALENVIERVIHNPAVIARDQSKRDIVSKALTGLALAQLRQGNKERAEAAMGELVRDFPDVVLSRAQFGPEAFDLYQHVRESVGAGGRGELDVNVDDPAVVVFVDERYEAVGNVKKADVIPGEYRVFTKRGSQEGRVYTVTVKANQQTVLAVDWLLDASLTTGATWAGFVFPRAEDRKAHEAELAVRLARAAQASGVVLVGIDKIEGRQAIVGSVLSLETGEPIRTGTVFLEPTEPSEQRLRVFARFLAGDDNTKGIDKVRVVAPSAKPKLTAATVTHEAPAGSEESHRGVRGPWKWVAAGGAVVALGAGVALVGINGRCTSSPLPGDMLCQRVYGTASGGYAAIGGGAALAALAGYLFFAHHGEEAPTTAIVPVSGGAVLTWGGDF